MSAIYHSFNLIKISTIFESNDSKVIYNNKNHPKAKSSVKCLKIVLPSHPNLGSRFN